MSVSRKSSIVFLLGLVLAAPAPAQQQFGPFAAPQGGMHMFQNPLAAQGGAMPQGAGFGRIVNTQIVPTTTFNGGFTPQSQWPTYQPPPPYPYNPYSYYYDPLGGALRGVGDLTISYGRYIQDYQRSRLINQEVERSKIETRRRLYDEWRYYQSMQ